MENKFTLWLVGALIGGALIGYALGTTQGDDYGCGHGGNYGKYRGEKAMMMDHSMSMDSMMDSMVRGLEGKTGDTFDQQFIDEMIVHHEGAVAMAELVLTQSKRPELLDLARTIINAQTTEIEQMKEWREKWF